MKCLFQVNRWQREILQRSTRSFGNHPLSRASYPSLLRLPTSSDHGLAEYDTRTGRMGDSASSMQGGSRVWAFIVKHHNKTHVADARCLVALCATLSII